MHVVNKVRRTVDRINHEQPAFLISGPEEIEAIFFPEKACIRHNPAKALHQKLLNPFVIHRDKINPAFFILDLKIRAVSGADDLPRLPRSLLDLLYHVRHTLYGLLLRSLSLRYDSRSDLRLCT